MTTTPTTVYYDGLCPLCSREIAHYRARIGDSPVSFVDIASADFDPAQHGVDLARAHKVLHVKVGNDMRSGMDAVIAMWNAIPGYRWLGRFMNLPVIHFFACVGYWLFARIRPYLGRRQKCDDGTCQR